MGSLALGNRDELRAVPIDGHAVYGSTDEVYFIVRVVSKYQGQDANQFRCEIIGGGGDPGVERCIGLTMLINWEAPCWPLNEMELIAWMAKC